MSTRNTVRAFFFCLGVCVFRENGPVYGTHISWSAVPISLGIQMSARPDRWWAVISCCSTCFHVFTRHNLHGIVLSSSSSSTTYDSIVTRLIISLYFSVAIMTTIVTWTPITCAQKQFAYQKNTIITSRRCCIPSRVWITAASIVVIVATWGIQEPLNSRRPAARLSSSWNRAATTSFVELRFVGRDRTKICQNPRVRANR